MAHALVRKNNNVVDNLIVVGPTYKAPDDYHLVEVPEGTVVNIGDTYRDGVFIPAPPPKPEVPESVRNFQGKTIARRLKLEETILATIAAIPDEDLRIAAQAAYETADFERNNPLLIQLLKATGNDDAAIDNIFIEAKKVKLG